MPCHDYVRAWERDRLTFVPDQKNNQQQDHKETTEKQKQLGIEGGKKDRNTEREGTAYI
jgi:hypothetical protein